MICIFIIIFYPVLDSPIYVRLVDGTTPNKGRVEVYRNGFWGTICKNGWDIPDASVVCRMLGYAGAWTAGCCTDYRGGTGPVWLSDLSCTGQENSLLECDHRGWGVNNCDHGKDAEVVCHSPPTEKPSQHSSAEMMSSEISQYLLPSATVITSSAAKSSTKQMSPSIPFNPKISKIQESSTQHTSSARVLATQATSAVFQKVTYLPSSFTVVVSSVISPSSSSLAVTPSSVNPTLSPGK